jgi:hypothetical protein
MTLTLHTASCSVHVPAALREHQRPIVDALLDATFAGTLSEAHVGQARSDGSLVVWSAPPEAVADVVRAYALAARIEVKMTCTLCQGVRHCPVHGEVSP